MLSDPTFCLLALAAVTLLGLSKGGFIGLGVVALPLMTLKVPPLTAAAIILPTLISQDMVSLWAFRRHWSGWNLKVMLPGVVVGVGVAGLFAAAMTAAQIRLVIGIIAGAFVIRHWLGARIERLVPSPGPISGVVLGTLGGITTMLANAGGPVWQMHILPQRLDKLDYVGTFTILFTVGNLTKLPAFGALGQLTTENLTTGVLLLPAAVLANYAGIWLGRRMPAELFFRVAYVLMFLISIELIRGALVELLRA